MKKTRRSGSYIVRYMRAEPVLLGSGLGGLGRSFDVLGSGLGCTLFGGFRRSGFLGGGSSGSGLGGLFLGLLGELGGTGGLRGGLGLALGLLLGLGLGGSGGLGGLAGGFTLGDGGRSAAELVREALDASAFWVPVKNGWQALQISTRSSGLVERVVKVLPQVQRTSHSMYSGWIPCFMMGSPFHALVSDQGETA